MFFLFHCVRFHFVAANSAKVAVLADAVLLPVQVLPSVLGGVIPLLDRVPFFSGSAARTLSPLEKEEILSEGDAFGGGAN